MAGFIKNIRQNIKSNTSTMTKEEKAEYIITYYWPHILGTFAIIALLVFLPVHFVFGNQKPEFTLVMVNQDINPQRDKKIAKAFAKESKISQKRINVDSDFNLSYGDVQLEGVNESSYEKFFFKWQGGELDAVIMPESFYRYCKELGGEFTDVKEFDTGNLSLYTDGQKVSGILVTDAQINAMKLDKTSKEDDIILFPSTGQHKEAVQKFLHFLDQEAAQ